MPLRTYDEIRSRAKLGKVQSLAVVEAGDAEVLKAVSEAFAEGIAKSFLIGRGAEIREISAEEGISIEGLEIIESPTAEESVIAAAKLVSEGRASMIMKGHLPTGMIMKGVLAKENGLRGDSILSHTMVAQADDMGRLLLMSDAGLNPAPDIDMLVSIIKNSVKVAHTLSFASPKVACLSAVESVTSKIPSTGMAAEVVTRFNAGEIPNCVVDGPLALDLALSPFAVEAKGYPNKTVAGRADILIVPEIVSGNVLGKSLIYLAKYRCGGIITGARVPIVLLSRSDTSTTKLDSIALACVYAQGNKLND